MLLLLASFSRILGISGKPFRWSTLPLINLNIPSGGYLTSGDAGSLNPRDLLFVKIGRKRGDRKHKRLSLHFVLFTITTVCSVKFFICAFVHLYLFYLHETLDVNCNNMNSIFCTKHSPYVFVPHDMYPARARFDTIRFDPISSRDDMLSCHSSARNTRYVL